MKLSEQAKLRSVVHKQVFVYFWKLQNLLNEDFIDRR